MQKTFTNKEYLDYVEKKSPKSKVAGNIVKAYAVGGVICVVGQFISNSLVAQGLGKDAASNLTVLIMVFIGAFLTGINVYDDIGRFAGAGSIVPITGFANSIVSPAMEFKSEGYVTGVGARMFFIAGPVLVYGISASVVVGILHYLLKF
ncbi:stage V sporulation protein AC [Pseudobacteroides cellulosolvens]|uniref:Stage V sporulation protein AC n=1 Tax=Pseudobacteroides cellulosolvens ATCC 35603 = DSM 2933 TaxID=398512 RepID=A0A0L6JS18_9FIRM|nr:stage V sporulation protein AC [Pseudobacteroides cellulosolvens]KNY28588.1 stage V sporulation protein AC [Pseudobacteroides cellulosolvens ATCC 35603 = DSM 2933]